MDIIDEIAEARKYILCEGVEPNTIVIPEDRRREIEDHIIDMPLAWGYYDKTGKVKVFGCDVIYSRNIDEIKVGYIV